MFYVEDLLEPGDHKKVTMMDIDAIKNLMADDAVASIETRGKHALVLGFWSSTGREVGVVVKPTATDLFDVSDAGESWAELVGEGLMPLRPSRNIREKVARLCALHGVKLRDNGVLYDLVKAGEIPAVARRIVAATTALDSFRVWHPEGAPKEFSFDVVAKETRVFAEQNGMKVIERSVVQGATGYQWSVPLLLEGKTRDRAAVLSSELPVDAAIQQAIGWTVDTRSPLVMLVKQSNEEGFHLPESIQHKVAIIARKTKKLPERIVRSAENLMRKVA